ncbi:MAG: PEP-CTERM/exosortase system-associated acyltransferase [Candidatus Competibacteraceae bacterium]|nr:PEP-CTERM/exosortase system-associated acyltransferase [Candidatus Competibacteraceae bacterium]
MFDQSYEVILADTVTSQAIHRMVRYHVYCLENQFEDAAAFPQGEEYDLWDSYSAQFIVRSRRLGTWIAAMRLILPHSAKFPIEELHCLTSQADLPRRNLAEISRICIIRSPNPHEINPYLDWNYGHISKGGESEVLLGMLRTIFLYGLAHDIECCYLLITQAFARLLRHLGIVLHKVGTPVDHRGVRIPYQVKLRESAKSMRAKSAQVDQFAARKTLAYRPFSALSAAEPVSIPLLHSTVPLSTAAKTVLRADGVGHPLV